APGILLPLHLQTARPLFELRQVGAPRADVLAQAPACYRQDGRAKEVTGDVGPAKWHPDQQRQCVDHDNSAGNAERGVPARSANDGVEGDGQAQRNLARVERSSCEIERLAYLD